MSPPAEPRSPGGSTDSASPISFEELEFAILTPSHDLSSFHCKNPELGAFLREDALVNQVHKISATTLVYWEEHLVGYFTLINDCIERQFVYRRDQRHGGTYRHYPALKIARLAVNSDFERRYIGTAMISMIYDVYNVISRYSGCRIITVDAKTDAIEFYRKFGFHEIRQTKAGRDRYGSDDSTLLYLNYTTILERLQSDDHQTRLSRFGEPEED